MKHFIGMLASVFCDRQRFQKISGLAGALSLMLHLKSQQFVEYHYERLAIYSVMQTVQHERELV